jgi:hypothetical protein
MISNVCVVPTAGDETDEAEEAEEQVTDAPIDSAETDAPTTPTETETPTEN